MRKLIAKSAILVLVALLANLPAVAQIRAVVSVTGYVYNEVSRQSINKALVKFIDAEQPDKVISSTTHSGGYYLVTSLKPGKKYTVRIECPGYFQTEYDVTAPNTAKYTEISRDFVIKPLALQQRLPIVVSPFDYKKAYMRAGADELLGDVVRVLTINPNVKLSVTAYADVDAGAEQNKQFSAERTNALIEYLVAAGINRSRLTAKPASTLDPLNPPPNKKKSKGKRYIGTTYLVIDSI